MKALRNGPDLNALRARYNRARGNEFTDPAVGSLARLTAQQWADREMAALTAAYESGRRLTPQQKQQKTLLKKQLRLLARQLKKQQKQPERLSRKQPGQQKKQPGRQQRQSKRQ